MGWNWKTEIRWKDRRSLHKSVPFWFRLGGPFGLDLSRKQRKNKGTTRYGLMQEPAACRIGARMVGTGNISAFFIRLVKLLLSDLSS
jgi:hypothetical protein